MKSLIILVALAGLTACTSLLAPVLKPDVTASAATLPAGNWTLDEKHAALTFKINHLGYANYVGRFEKFSASLNGDPKSPAAAKLETIIDMTSLDIANDDFAKTLMGPDWFDAAKFPQAQFVSGEITMTGADTAQISGTLTLKGQSAPVTLNAKFNGGAVDRLRNADVIGFSATGKIDRTVFGVSKFSGLLTNDVTIEIEAEFVKGAN